MNMLDRMRNRMKARDEIKINNKKNCLKWSHNETWNHIKAKLIICQQLKMMGCDFYSEVEFKNGSRADILDADHLIIIEVLETEDISNIEKKSKKYPFRIKAVKAKEILKEENIFI